MLASPQKGQQDHSFSIGENNSQSSLQQHQHQMNENSNDSLTGYVKVLTYNTFLRPPPVRNNADDYKNERQKLLLGVIDQFDIVCAQEVFGFFNRRKHRLIYGSLKKGFYYHAESPNPSFFSSYLVDGGLLTLSKFPIVYEEYRAFGYGVLSDALSQKGILYTKIQINDSYLHLFNTHLQASYIGEESKYRATVVTRMDQLQVMRKFVDEMLDLHQYESDHLVLLAGDFNVDALGPSFRMDLINQFQNLIEKMDLAKQTNFSEYDILHCILSNYNADKLIDLIRESHDDKSQITFGDVTILPDGTEVAAEVALTHKVGHMTKMCLDYILEFQPSISSKSDLVEQPIATVGDVKSSDKTPPTSHHNRVA